MWPSALQLTRDECRGILRRLELESYSNVISVFRAQGGLSEPKAKLLEDLRNIFHISQERHRAEARRVANDEQLSTIAEAISGPNTWQEWSREGRRAYPLLPRVPPQTALSIVANHVAAEVTNENSKLPYPTETGAAQQQHQEFTVSTERTSESISIVTSDPLQPDIPEIRKNLKRNLPSDALTTTKKRIMSPSLTAGETPLCPSTQIRKLYHNHSKTQSKQRNALTKKNNNSPTKRLTAASKKRLASGDADNLNKTNSGVATVFQSPNNSQPLTNATIPTNTPANESLPPPPPPPLSTISQEIANETHEKTPIIATTTATPQIATSKKDISKNLSKLNMIANQTALPQQHQQEKLHECKTEKLSTPVQKYIVEERTPMLISNAPTLPSHLLDKQQVVPSKLKPMTAIIPTPLSTVSKAKISSVKTLKTSEIVCSTPVSSQPQVFNVIDASTPPYVPHTPPAIINISSKFEPEHGKVLTTKLLPLMLSSGGKLEPSNGSPVHMKNITHPNPSPATSTVFRKPNIIKGSVPMKQKIQITNQQIISPPTVANLKMSPHLHLKGVPGGGPIHNRKSVKIFSSPNGKMFIQSADSPVKPMTKLNTIVTAQKGSGHIVNTSAAPGRVAIQKVQIIPAPTTTTSTGSIVPKPIAITKPNMIFMPMTSTSNVKKLPIVKSNKFGTVLPTTMAPESTVSNVTSAKSNVFVIGAVQSSPQTILPKDLQGFSNRNNMITEDTPVDIISTPIIVDVDSIDTQSAKPTETIDLTGIQDKSSMTGSATGTVSSAVLQSRLTSESSYVETAAAKKMGDSMDSGEGPSTVGQTSRGENDAMIMGVTDWEMELDQEANKTRALNAQKRQKLNTDERMVVSGGSGGSGGEEESSDEHFVDDDVIEEQEETEEEFEDGCDPAGDDGGNTTESKREEQSHEDGDQENYHRHHLSADDEDETIEVGDEQIKTEGDVIQYDESYESVNDEMDENIAIEYVEEDQDGYEEKIDSTSSDRKETMECNSNIVLIKQSTEVSAGTLDSSENKSQSSNDCMVSVEEITSTTQQNIASSQHNH